ncbi:NT-C2 domain-containing protein [Heracleum sosnowskyi]|uniref:NT-C2 domain-containing protein n=1 Tax=Heracleum sosnowskyi TaxID=360622 RepID=A0AAD8HXW7_9APIA|nr:NT-C2 domain-containing protein [Heracleum sosnowskyi]
MFKSARWRSDKSKIKAVFRLHFHATQVSLSGGDSLMISVIPADVGKPTAKLEKVKVNNAGCYWEKPIYETVKFILDPRTGKINERLYHFIIATDSSKFGILGEVSFDFANYASTKKLTSLSLPLKTAKFEAVLHVSIERIQDTVDQREVGEGENFKHGSEDESLKTQFSNSETDINIKNESSQDGSLDKVVTHVAELKGNCRVSIASDVTISSSDSISGPDTKECERLKDLQKRAETAKVRNKLQIDGGDPRALLEELRQELNHEKELNVNLRIQLQKTQESNSELLFAVRDLDEMLEAKNNEIVELSNKSARSENANSSHVSNSKCEADVDDDQIALEELVKDHNTVKDAFQLEEKITDLYSELDSCRRDRDDLEVQLEQLSLDYEILKQENHDISYKLEQSQVQEQLKMQYECSTSYATLNDLETQIESLENELKKQSEEFSGSLITIIELENHVKILQEELEKQAQGFEADLEVLTSAKVEQEKRAIRAEETLRKAQRQNVNTAERLQKEFKGIYIKISSTLDVNDKLATKALTEANEFRLEKNHLEEMLQQAKKEVQSVKDLYEAKLLDLLNQIHFKTKEIEQIESEREYKSKETETQRRLAEETHKLLSEEILTLQSEIERLTNENSVFSEQERQNENLRAELNQLKLSTNNHSEEIQSLQSQIARLRQENSAFSDQQEQVETLKVELEQMKESIEETEIQVLRGIAEGDELELTGALLKMEVEKLQKELNAMRSVKDEIELMAENLQSEVETLTTKYNEFKDSALEEELGKKILKKQVIQLTDDVKTRDDMLSVVEKKIRDEYSQAPVFKVHETTDSKLVPACDSTEYVNLVEKIRLLEDQIMLKEVSLKTSSTTFFEKEKDLQIKIEELEKSLGMPHQKAECFCGYKIQNEASDAEGFTLNTGVAEESVITAGYTSSSESTSVNGCLTSFEDSNNDISLEDGFKDSATHSRGEENLSESSDEMTLLKARNRSMEGELKDMQERYSAISLKFAEVEGERQKLVMKLRSIKNSKKSLS